MRKNVWDHPRTCGEKLIYSLFGGLIKGSPPHMRGKEIDAHGHGENVGITPAHAGKSLNRHAYLRVAGDHPRTCGEKSIAVILEWLDTGSPPHMRGKAAASASFCKSVRDHPRTCGEKSATVRTVGYFLGSPPHMRGKEPKNAIVGISSGITPAHAGKSSFGTTLCVRLWDHPRTCGEKSRSQRPLAWPPGSPPHMRGKESDASAVSLSSGITPAHAGKRSYPHVPFCAVWDHPRTCGEKLNTADVRLV